MPSPPRSPFLLTTTLILLAFLTGCRSEPERPTVHDAVHIFYYGWYADEATDGEARHWNHEVLGVDDPARFPGGRDIGANFYPALGPYSSNDPRVIDTHLRQCADAGIGVLVVSWWGAGSFEDRNLERLLDAAEEFGIGLAIHLEPFPGRDAATSRAAIVDLLDRYGDHPALHRSPGPDGRPYFYVYDSYLTPASDWQRLLQPDGDLTIRGTPFDIVAIGLWVGENEGEFFLTGGFDGFYTYFASDGFTYGSAASSWPTLAAWARDHDKIFVPCAGPGYLDTRIRPWNDATTRPREQGAYYDRMFAAALAVDPPLIGITSFNEWHEGTQIEPAVPLTIEGFTYVDYRPLEPDHYLRRTRHWVDVYRQAGAP